GALADNDCRCSLPSPTRSTRRPSAPSPCSTQRRSSSQALPEVRTSRQTACTPDRRLLIRLQHTTTCHAYTLHRLAPESSLPHIAVYRMAATTPPYAQPEIVRGQHCTAGALREGATHSHLSAGW